MADADKKRRFEVRRQGLVCSALVETINFADAAYRAARFFGDLTERTGVFFYEVKDLLSHDSECVKLEVSEGRISKGFVVLVKVMIMD